MILTTKSATQTMKTYSLCAKHRSKCILAECFPGLFRRLMRSVSTRMYYRAPLTEF